MEDKFDLLETKLKRIGVPYVREGDTFSTNFIFDDVLQKYAKEFGLVKIGNENVYGKKCNEEVCKI